MAANAQLLPELRRTLEALRSAVHMLRQPETDARAVAFLCSSAQRRLEALVEASEPARQKRRVLIADADRSWSDLVAETLRLDGHEATAAATTSEALAACRAFRPDVMLVDIGMTGHEASRSLRDASRSAVMVAITGWSRDSDRRMAHEAGFAHYVKKPVSPEVIAELVATLPAAARRAVRQRRKQRVALRSAR